MRIALGHPAAVVVAAAALAAVMGVFTFTRPVYQREVLKPPRDHGLPYTRAVYGAADARRAFASVGVVLTRRSRSAAVTSLGSAGDVVEVGIFADRRTVEATGFSDYTLVPPGRYVHFPRGCGGPVPDAERWRDNVRVVVACRAAGGRADAWLRRVERALARL